tara:strand:- start:321 stop:1283 length:963 start_codon:yes stop_codon:yes gene_type:complete
MYFSKKNKNHIFNLITDIVLKETGLDINSDSDYIDLYRFKYPLIFNRTSVDNLVDLNKELIDEITPLLINDIKTKYIKKDIHVLNEESIKVDSIETKINMSPNKEKDSNHNSELKEKPMKKLQINSSLRTCDSLNRYDYSVVLDDYINKIILSEIIIPVEGNILFENPTICVNMKIKDKDMDIFCRYDKNIILKGKQYNIYKPIINLELELNDPGNLLHIKIKTNSKQDINSNTDKISIQKVKNIRYKNKDFICIITNTNLFEKNEFINIYSNQKLIRTKEIIDIKDKYILLEPDTMIVDNGEYYLLKNIYHNDLIINYN